MQMGFSAKSNTFYFLEEEAAYKKSGTWQDDIIPVSNDVWLRFVGDPPAGKERGAGKDGMPEWIDIKDQEKKRTEDHNSYKDTLLEEADKHIRILKIVEEVHGLNDTQKKTLAAWKEHLTDVYRLEINGKDTVDWPLAPGKT